MNVKKVCAITGGNAGIGYQTARQLSADGFKILILARNADKGTKAVEQIRAETNNEDVQFIPCDLSSQKSIRAASDLIKESTKRLDVLINNAGTWYSKLTYTEDNIETMFAVNHLAYFLLTHQLLGMLSASPDARIINVGSDSHFHGKMHFDDLYLTQKYHGLKAYAQSKLANVLFTYELDRKLREKNFAITVNCVQPGLVKTDIGIKHTISFHALAWRIRRVGGVSPEVGAKTSVYLASSEEVEGISGKYWDKCQPKSSSRKSYNEEDADRLWKISARLCNIADYFAHIV